MNKEYSKLTQDKLVVKNEKNEINVRELKVENPTKVLELENKIELLKNIISNETKIINNQQEFIETLPLWFKGKKYASLIILVIFIPLFGFIQGLATWMPFTLAMLGSSLIAIYMKKISRKIINGSNYKMTIAKELQEETEKRLTKELAKVKEETPKDDYHQTNVLKLNDTLSKEDIQLLDYAYNIGYNQKVKRLVRTK